MHSLSQGWYLTAMLSLLCALGTLVIFLDDVYACVLPSFITRRFAFQLKENYGFMNGSLAFSAGCLLFTALYRLLPEARSNLRMDEDRNGNVYLVASFVAGVATCFLFNQTLHWLTAELVVHCAHDDKVEELDLESQHSHLHAEPLETSLEEAPLLAPKRLGLLHYFDEAPQVGECKGYLSAEQCLHEHGLLHFCEIPQMEESPAISRKVSHVLRHSAHHHHVNLPLLRLLLIGVQTILAMTLHKFPEGFITYVTAETNPQLGFSIFLSLVIHNFTEGFLMCLPLYYLFQLGSVRWSKLRAVGISAFLGGVSQPLGAMVGYFFLHATDSVDYAQIHFIFGISMAVTCGFLCVVALSMYGSAVQFSGRPNFVLVWCVVGMCVIGFSSIYLKGN